MTSASSIDSLLTASTERHPHLPALSFWGMPLTYSELNEAVERMTDRFSDGSRVGIIAPNVPALVITLFAAWRTGAAAIPINARLREYEIRRLLQDAQVTEIVSVGAYRGYSFASLAPQIAPEIPSLRSWLLVDPLGEPEEELTGPNAVAGDETLDSSISAILYTSGTTGAPKGALSTHDRELAGAAAMASTLGLTPEDTAVFVVPISHAFGLTCLLSTVASGAHAVLVVSTFSLEPMMEAVAANRATVLHGSPALFTSFLKVVKARSSGNGSDGDASGSARVESTIRTGFVAGAACPPHILEGLDEIGMRILNLFGMTEIGAAASCRADDPPSIRYTTSGLPLPGYEIRISPDAGPGNIGEIQVRGPYVTPGYFRQPDATVEAFDEGWFHTGDLGEMDEHGHLSISGRIKEVVQVAGLNVFPAEVEGFLATHPDVDQAVVVGVPHETMGEALQAFVVAREGSNLTPQSVLQFARQRIAGYKLPYAIEIVPEVPLLPSGKPDRTALAASLGSASGADSTKSQQLKEDGPANAGTHSPV